jgi:hypothetical protein
MASGLIGNSTRPSSYTRYSIVTFPSWRALQDTAVQLLAKKPSGTVENAKREFRKVRSITIGGKSKLRDIWLGTTQGITVNNAITAFVMRFIVHIGIQKGVGSSNRP